MARTSGGRFRPLVVALIAAGAVAVAVVVTGGGGPTPAAAPAPTTPAPTTTAREPARGVGYADPAPVGSGPIELYGTGAEKLYLTVGTNDRRQFTDEEFRRIASEYSVVVFAKFHAGWDVELHHEATRRLAELNPDLRIYAYISTKYWFNGNRWGTEIDSAWLLRSSAGEVVAFTADRYDLESKDLGSFIDVSNADYRAWVLDVARSWMDAAPYAGIRFDAADPIGDFGDRDVRKWRELLTPERLEAYNDGIETLFATFTAELEGREILFNGISPSPIRGPGRNLFQLDYTAGAMSENFCITDDGEPHDLVADIEIMRTHHDKVLNLRAAYDPSRWSDEERARLQRLCLGTFLAGWQPGFSHLNMGMGYGLAQLDHQPVDVGLNLGRPTGDHVVDGDVVSRGFEHGWVYVNTGSQPVPVVLGEPAVLMAQGKAVGVVEGSHVLAGHDAAFFVRLDLVDPAALG